MAKKRTCKKCGETKPIEEFYERKSGGRKIRRHECKVCTRRRIRKRYKENPEVMIERANTYYKNIRKKDWGRVRFKRALNSSRAHARKGDFAPCNATEEEVRAAFTGFCHSCGVPESELVKNLNLDHDHCSGKMRGFLCGRCNTALGQLRNSPKMVSALAAYIEQAEVSV